MRLASLPVPLPANTSKGIVVRCPMGMAALGGGFSVFPGTGVDVVDSRPLDGPSPFDERTDPGWLIQARNASTTDSSLGGYVVCAAV